MAERLGSEARNSVCHAVSFGYQHDISELLKEKLAVSGQGNVGETPVHSEPANDVCDRPQPEKSYPVSASLYAVNGGTN